MSNKEEDNRIKQKIGSNLKKIRLQKGLKQIEVAAATDLNRSYISRIECGKARISLDSIYQLVLGLEITSEELLGY
jgi:transcriptional regulator with XRE-family HTH domain